MEKEAEITDYRSGLTDIAKVEASVSSQSTEARRRMIDVKVGTSNAQLPRARIVEAERLRNSFGFFSPLLCVGSSTHHHLLFMQFMQPVPPHR